MTNKANTAKIGATTGGAPRLSSYSDPVYTGKLVPDYVTAVNEAMKTSRTTVVFKDEWKDGALAIVDGMLAIASAPSFHSSLNTTVVREVFIASFTAVT